MWNRFLHRLRLARELSFPDWLTLMEAWWGLLAWYVRLRFTSFENLTKSSNSILAESPKNTSIAYSIFKLIGWASRLHLFDITCLVQSLTLQRMLSRRGIPSEIRIGAMKTGAGFHAHAWVELDGNAIGDVEGVDRGFRVLKKPG